MTTPRSVQETLDRADSDVCVWHNTVLADGVPCPLCMEAIFRRARPTIPEEDLGDPPTTVRADHEPAIFFHHGAGPSPTTPEEGDRTND